MWLHLVVVDSSNEGGVIVGDVTVVIIRIVKLS